MIVDGLSKDFSAAEAEGICRLQSDLSDLRARETELDSAARRKSRSLRRKRLEIRRMNALSKEKSDVDGSVPSDERCGGSRKKRSEFKLGKKSCGNGLIDGSGYGTVAHIGRRREMEDAVAAELCFLQRCGRSYDFYGVYDGHGGRRVAEACAEMMHGMVARALGEDESGAWEEPLGTAFRNMDEEVNRYGTEVAAMGSTAVVAVVGEDELVVANCGDSRAVLCRGGAAVQLSEDHKPDRADEQERIEASGGMVIKWDGARVIGVLATSRSIGDYFLKPYVITDPEVRVINRTTTDEFLILASDGLWDVVTNELACHVARRCLAGQLERGSKPNNGNSGGEGNLNGKSKGKMVKNRFEEAAAVLAELAITKGSGDNVSVVVVGLS